MEEDAGDQRSQFFDQTGNFLVSAGRDKIRVRDLAQKVAIQEYDTPAISTMALSIDREYLL